MISPICIKRKQNKYLVFLAAQSSLLQILSLVFRLEIFMSRNDDTIIIMKQSITIKLNVWIIVGILLLTNLITIGLWQPWNSTVSNRTISVTGFTTLEAEADQYIFNPYYQENGTDKLVVNNNLVELSKTIVAKLKTLGVSDSAIKTSVSSYDYGIYYDNRDKSVSGALNITITIKDKVLAQQVQDYLATTPASGSISPQVSFSTEKQKELEKQAREEALNDAKTKAQTSAEQLGAKLGRVISVSDSTNGGTMPLPWLIDSNYRLDTNSSSEPGSASASSYAIQPGLNEYNFNVEVSYEIN